MEDRRFRPWLARLSLLSGSVLVSFLMVEVALRVLGFPSRVLEFSPAGVPGYFFMKPNQDYVEHGFYAYQPPHRIRINSMGLRGNEINPDRRWTILALGDSFTFGAGVNFEDTFVYVLEKRLRSQFEPGVEVVNAGYAGATIDHELVVFERQGLPLKPDVVILQFFTNDVEDLLQREERERIYRQIDFPLKRYLRHTAAYVLLLKLKLSWMGRNVNRDRAGTGENAPPLSFRGDEYYAQTPSARNQRGWDAYLGHLGKLVDRTRRERIRLVILTIPDEYQVTRPHPFPAPQENIRAFARRNSVPVVDPLSAFRRLWGAGEILYLPQDGHLTPRGHAAIADLLVGALMESDLAYLPARRP